jgi:hypothetical protein
MNNSNFDNVENFSAAHGDNSISGQVAEHVRSALGASFMHADVARLRQGDHGKGSALNDLSQPLPAARIGEKGDIVFCATPVKDSPQGKETKETPEQRLDQKIKDSFGADVFEHLKDWDWLVANRKKLEDGFNKITDPNEKWDMAKRMRDLSVVDGKPLVFLKKLDGPTHGSLVPKRHDIMLRRGRFHSDDYLGQVYH